MAEINHWLKWTLTENSIVPQQTTNGGIYFYNKFESQA